MPVRKEETELSRKDRGERPTPYCRLSHVPSRRSYYKRALADRFFTEQATLAEFKRIHLTNLFFPDDTVGYAKGGNADGVADSTTVADFHAFSYAGQMVVKATPVTFCFVVNWMSVDPNSTSAALTPAFGEVIKGCLVAIKQQLVA